MSDHETHNDIVAKNRLLYVCDYKQLQSVHVKTLDNFDYKDSFYSFTYVVPTTNNVCFCFLSSEL